MSMVRFKIFCSIRAISSAAFITKIIEPNNHFLMTYENKLQEIRKNVFGNFMGRNNIFC